MKAFESPKYKSYEVENETEKLQMKDLSWGLHRNFHESVTL
jgi:hypothetical protein